MIRWSAVMMLAATVTSGCMEKHLVFGTTTKFALDISQRADQTIDVSMGYDRGELASIPTGEGNDASSEQDAYSVLGTFHVRYGNPFTEDLRLNQFFATGQSALVASRSDRFRKYFGRAAGAIAVEALPDRGSALPPPAAGAPR